MAENEDIVRVLRVVLYEGPRSLVEKQVAQSLHGTRLGMTGISKDGVKITAVTLSEFPEVLAKARQDLHEPFGFPAFAGTTVDEYNAQTNTPQSIERSGTSMAQMRRRRDLEAHGMAPAAPPFDKPTPPTPNGD